MACQLARHGAIHPLDKPRQDDHPPGDTEHRFRSPGQNRSRVDPVKTQPLVALNYHPNCKARRSPQGQESVLLSQSELHPRCREIHTLHIAAVCLLSRLHGLRPRTQNRRPPSWSPGTASRGCGISASKEVVNYDRCRRSAEVHSAPWLDHCPAGAHVTVRVKGNSSAPAMAVPVATMVTKE